MKKILFLNTIQSTENWDNDCNIISHNVLKKLGYSLPNDVYINNFVNFIKNFISDESIGSYEIENIQDMLDDISRESFDENNSQSEGVEYYEFNISIDEITKINSVIIEEVVNYYKDSELLKKLKDIDKEVIFVYPSSKYQNLLALFYKHSNPTFKSTTSDYDKSLEELKIMLGNDINILKI